MNLHRDRSHQGLPRTVWAAIGIVAVTAAVWIPFGIHKSGLVEDWTFFRVFEQDGYFTRVVPTRPLTTLGWAIGHVMTPDSFVGLNIVHVLCFLAKGTLLFLIVRLVVPRSDDIAFLAAALFIIHPSDEAIFSLRNTNYQVALVLFLGALWLLLLFGQRRRWSLLIGSLICIVGSLLSVEIAFPLAMAAPWLLLVERPQPPRKSFLVAAAAWYTAIAAAAIIPIRSLFLASSYQSMLFQGETGGPAVRIRNLASPLARAYYQSFVGPWKELLAHEQSNLLYVLIAAIAAMVVGVVSFRISRSDHAIKTNIPSSACLALLGCLWIALGFGVFLLIPTHRGWNLGTFLFPSAGASIATIAVLAIASQVVTKRPYLLLIAASALVGLATLAALHQHRRFVVASLNEERFLASIVRQAPRIQERTLIIILDPAHEVPTADPFFFGASSTSGHIRDALSYLYQMKTLSVFLCYPQGGFRGATREACRFESDGVHIYRSGQRAIIYPYERVLAFAYEGREARLATRLPPPYGTVAAGRYAPAKLIQQTPARRANSLLRTARDHRHPDIGVDRIHLEFDKPVPGSGWSTPEGSRTWMNSKEASIDLLLRSNRDYLLTFRVGGAIKPELVHTLVVTANEDRVPLMFALDQQKGRVFAGRILRDAVTRERGAVHLVFRVGEVVSPRSLGINADDRTLGLSFDWLSVRPKTESSSKPNLLKRQ